MTQKKPIIGINASVTAGPSGEVSKIIVNVSYVDSVIAAGGLPVVLPANSSDEVLDAQIALCDGFVFVGGPDLNPKLYGQDFVHPTSGELNERRESFDLRLIRKVIDLKKPFLAVCLGCQQVNVVRGGTLIQDITSQTETTVAHTQKHAPYYVRQEVDVVAGTKLAALVGEGILNANTAHHQAVDKPGEGVKISSYCPIDGIVESFELEDYPYGIAVQWHPEMISHEPQQLKLFQGLVEEASK